MGMPSCPRVTWRYKIQLSPKRQIQEVTELSISLMQIKNKTYAPVTLACGFPGNTQQVVDVHELTTALGAVAENNRDHECN